MGIERCGRSEKGWTEIVPFYEDEWFAIWLFDRTGIDPDTVIYHWDDVKRDRVYKWYLENGSHDKNGKTIGAIRRVVNAESAPLPPQMVKVDESKPVTYRFNYKTRQVEADNLVSVETAEEKKAREERAKVIGNVVDTIGRDLIWNWG